MTSKPTSQGNAWKGLGWLLGWSLIAWFLIEQWVWLDDLFKNYPYLHYSVLGAMSLYVATLVLPMIRNPASPDEIHFLKWFSPTFILLVLACLVAELPVFLIFPVSCFGALALAYGTRRDVALKG